MTAKLGGEKIILEGATYRVFRDIKLVGQQPKDGYAIYRSNKILRLVGFVWQTAKGNWCASGSYRGKKYDSMLEAIKAEIVRG